MEPAEAADEDALRLTLLGPLLATILHQRGYLVLHASGLCGASGAVAVSAHSGTGKSTTAAALVDAGYALLTDDLLAIDMDGPRPVVLPGGSGIKLWDASAEALGRDPTDLDTIGERYIKRALPIYTTEAPAPLRALYILNRGDAQLPRELRPSRAVMEVMSRSYCSELLRLTDTERNLAQASALVRDVPVLHLERGESFDGFSDWKQGLLEDVRMRIGPSQ